MKKITSVIAIVLLAALLLTGCDFIPLKKDFSQYGFKFTIAGEVTEKEENKAGYAVLYTKFGKMTFTKHNAASALVAEGLLFGAGSKETLENGAKFYTYNAKEDSAGSRVIETHYFVGATDGSTWEITCVTPESDYDKDALLKVYSTVEFVVTTE